MKYLFIFLKKQSFFLLFVLLEGIAITLLANYNNYQKAGIFNTSNVITGSVHSFFSGIGDYFFLQRANEQLNRQNALLLQKQQLLQGIPDSTFEYDSLYTFIPARVVSNTSRNRNNYIMINKGRRDGVQKEMGLLSPYGVAGIIVEVSSHYSTAMSLLHKDARISARLKSSGQMVNVVWDGMDYRRGTIEDIPGHIRPRPGDTVITSGYSFVFPKNLLIGTVGDKISVGGNFNRAELLFSTDFNNLYHAYVTKNNDSEELDSLDMVLPDE
jgi:rod shape-determining protein MreC